MIEHDPSKLRVTDNNVCTGQEIRITKIDRGYMKQNHATGVIVRNGTFPAKYDGVAVLYICVSTIMVERGSPLPLLSRAILTHSNAQVLFGTQTEIDLFATRSYILPVQYGPWHRMNTRRNSSYL